MGTTTSTTTTTTTTPRPINPITCSYANNSLGQCRCNGQLWIAHECHSGFFCLGADDELVVDPHNGGGWECHKTNENTRPLICPGKFMTECACTPEETPDEPEECKIGPCGCDNQVWVAHDCHEAQICYPNQTSEIINCPERDPELPFINVNLITHQWFCSNDSDNCLGSFHVGCRADLMPEPDNGSSSIFASLLVLALPIVVTKVCSVIMI